MRTTIFLSTAGILLLTACSTASHIPSTDQTGNASSDTSVYSISSSAIQKSSSSALAPVGDSSQARIVNMQVENWAFVPNTITARKGERITVHLTNVSGEHSFTSDALGVDVPINEGETKDIVIPTDKIGVFSFRCAVPCGPGHRDMTGQIVIN